MRKDNNSWKSIMNCKYLIYIMRSMNFWEMKILKSHLKKKLHTESFYALINSLNSTKWHAFKVVYIL